MDEATESKLPDNVETQPAEAVTEVTEAAAEVPAQEAAPEAAAEIPAQEAAPEAAAETPAQEAAPEAAAETPAQEAAPEADEAPAQEAVPEADEAPAEMSLEGRKEQLEEKITQEMGSPPGPALGKAPVYAGGPPKKQKMAAGTKAYIAVVASLLTVFTVVFVVECVRVYKEKGFMGGALDGGFSDSDSPYGGFDFHFGTDDSDFFPFDFDSEEDTDDREKPSAPTDSDERDTSVAAAPDSDSVLNAEAAKLKAEDQPKDIDSAKYTARLAYQKVENSVVNIVVYQSPEGVGKEEYKYSTGSGIIVSEDGYIITNSHVIDDSKSRGVEIITTSGDSYEAVVVGYDTRTDLSVLKIDAQGLTPVEFVDSSQIEVGQDAIAVGNPGGTAYSNSLTRGVVSALNRTVRTNTVVQYIQTDAAINPGNSGGPLLNSAGQVMGITTIKIANTDYEGMGFAIPSNTVIEIANSLISNGYVEGRVKLGVTGTVYNDYVSGIQGIQIVEINNDSPLSEIDEVRIGDIITKIDNEKTPTFQALYTILGSHDPGDEITVELYREPSAGDAGKTYEVKVSLIADNGSDK